MSSVIARLDDGGYVEVPSVPYSDERTSLPDLRLALMGIVARVEEVDDLLRPSVAWTDPDDKWKFFRTLLGALNHADLYWVNEEVVDLIMESAQSLPDVTLTDNTFPGFAGLVLFGRGIIGDTDIGAISWQPNAQGYDIVPWHISSAPGTVGRLTFGGLTHWRAGTSWADRANSNELLWVRRVVATLLSIINSPGITHTQSSRPDRPTRRRSKRAGVDLGATRFITLRSSASSHGSADCADSTYRHRWVVRGHWRSQPCGPQRSERRAVYIAPHIKGPDGAPLLHGEKVHVVSNPNPTTAKDNNT